MRQGGLDDEDDKRTLWAPCCNERHVALRNICMSFSEPARFSQFFLVKCPRWWPDSHNTRLGHLMDQWLMFLFICYLISISPAVKSAFSLSVVKDKASCKLLKIKYANKMNYWCDTLPLFSRLKYITIIQHVFIERSRPIIGIELNDLTRNQL